MLPRTVVVLAEAGSTRLGRVMKSRHLAAISLVALLAVVFPSAADACSCMTGPELCRLSGKAEAIFEATVASISTRSRAIPGSTLVGTERVVRLHDVRAWKGAASDVVVTGMGNGDCGYPFEVGVRYVIVGGRTERGAEVRTGSCSLTRPLARAGAMREYIDSLSSPSTGGRLWGTIATQTPWATGDGVPRGPMPIADARVTIRGPVEQTTSTTADGHFSFEALPPGNYRLEAEAGGRKIDSRYPPVTLTGDYACTVMDIVAPDGASIRGVVTYDDGTPIAGAPVELVAADVRPPKAFLGLGATTDALGAYEFPHVAPGRYRVGVGAIGGPSRKEPFALAYGRDDRGDVVIVVQQDGEALELTPIVTRKLWPMRIAGTVSYPDGSPAQGLVVTAAALGEGGPVRGHARAETRGDGGFALNLFNATKYRVTVARGERVIHRVDLEATDAPLLIVLPAR